VDLCRCGGRVSILTDAVERPRVDGSRTRDERGRRRSWADEGHQGGDVHQNKPYCRITSPLEELKYRSVDLQEACATPDAVLQRHFPRG
jgi:hypothetical protein